MDGKILGRTFDLWAFEKKFVGGSFHPNSMRPNNETGNFTANFLVGSGPGASRQAWERRQVGQRRSLDRKSVV